MKSFGRYMACTTLCCLISLGLHCQELNHYNFNKLYNFNVTTIYDIAQDDDGTFWLGSNQGLIKFDGRNFQTYTPKNFDKDASNIKFTADGKVWFSNFGGQLFYWDNDSIYTVINHDKNVGFIFEYFVLNKHTVLHITSLGKDVFMDNITQQLSETIWRPGTNSSCLAVQKKSKSVDLYTINHSIKEDTLNSYIQRIKLNTKTSEIEKLARINILNKSSKTGLFEHNNKQYFCMGLAEETLLYEIPEQNFFDKTEPIKIPISGLLINKIEGFNNDIFIHTKKGLYKTSQSNQYKKILNNYNTSCLFEDREKNLWIGTLNAGIIIVPNKTMTHSILSNNAIVTSIFDKTGNLYFLDFNGSLFKCAPPYNNPVLISSNFEGCQKMAYNPFKNELLFNSSTAIFSIDNQMFYTQKTNAYFNDLVFPSEDLVLTSNPNHFAATSFFKQPVNSLKLGFQVKNNMLQTDESYFVIERGRTEGIQLESGTEGIYVDFLNGLQYYSKENQPKALTRKGDPILASSMYPTDKKGAWVITENQSILRLEEGVLVYHKDLNFIPTYMIQRNNLLFLAAPEGIHRLDLEKNTISLIDQTDGLIDEKVVSLFFHKDTLCVLGANNLQKIPINYTFKNTVAPYAEIAEVKLFNKTLPTQRHYAFSYNENSVSFLFNANAIRSQRNYKFHYRLKGASNQWLETNADNPFAKFYQLTPGNYTFEMYLENEDGQTSDIKTIDFSIDSYFTQKWWFYALLVLVTGGTLLFFFRRRTKRLQRESKLQGEAQELKKEVYKSKISAIRAQMNPHFMFNALNTIQEFIVTNQSEVASEYLADFADLMRMYLEQSKHDNIMLRDEFAAMEIYLRLENLRFYQALDYHIEYNTINLDEAKIPVMLLQPFVENAIKHGLLHRKGHKSLVIEVSHIERNGLLIVITDNGIGRAAAQKINAQQKKQHESFSSSAIQQRIDILNKSDDMSVKLKCIDLKNSNDEASGTQVRLSLQYHELK